MVRPVTLGDSCLSIVFDETIDPAVNRRCVAIAESLAQSARPGVRDIVPTYNAVAVHFDSTRCSREALASELGVLAAMDMPDADHDKEPMAIPVKYGGEFGPDLAAVAEFGRCSEQEVAQLHARKVYRVYMLGFLPGFAYMGSVDPRIAMPRLDTPRLRVAAGSVGIAGGQTGVYPYDAPGGWRIIGRTAVNMFDVAREPPFLVKAGDLVKFVIA
jgi:KipI family sensor histidine kinase inhibitor